MLIQGSFWHKVSEENQDNQPYLYFSLPVSHSHSQSSMAPLIKGNPTNKVVTLFKKHYKNLSENKLITTLHIERYSDQTCGIYFTFAQQQYTMAAFNYLSQYFQGGLALMGPYGPIALRGSLENLEREKINLDLVLCWIDQYESIQPTTIREELMDLLFIEKMN